MVERRSALARLAVAARGPAEASVRLAELPHTGKILLRGEPDQAAFLAAAGSALGVAPPVEPCTSASGGAVTVLWFGPDEWLVVTPAGEEDRLAARLRAALSGIRSAVVEVTDSRTVCRLAGPRARDVLAKGCPLDLHARAFPPGAVKQSLLAGVDVTVHHLLEPQSADGPAYDLYVLRSCAEYLWRWLLDAGREYGVQALAWTESGVRPPPPTPL